MAMFTGILHPHRQTMSPQSSPTPAYVIPCSLAGELTVSTSSIPELSTADSSSSSGSLSPSSPVTPSLASNALPPSTPSKDPFTEYLTTSPIPPPEFGSPRQLVRFDTECVLIPEPGSKYYKELERSRSRSRSRVRSPTRGGLRVVSNSETEDPKERKERKRLVMQNRSYSLPLWKVPSPRKTSGGEDEEKKRVKINFRVPVPIFERGRRSRSPSPPLSPILHNNPLTLPIPIPNTPPNPIYTNPHPQPHSPSSPTALTNFIHSLGASPSSDPPLSASTSPPASPLHTHAPTALLPPPTHIQTVPLRSCCANCHGVLHDCLRTIQSGAEWTEKWTRGAARRRRRRSSSASFAGPGPGQVNGVANAGHGAEGEGLRLVGEGGVIDPTAYGVDLEELGLDRPVSSESKALPVVDTETETEEEGTDLDEDQDEKKEEGKKKKVGIPTAATLAAKELKGTNLNSKAKKTIAVDEVDKKIMRSRSKEGLAVVPSLPVHPPSSPEPTSSASSSSTSLIGTNPHPHPAFVPVPTAAPSSRSTSGTSTPTRLAFQLTTTNSGSATPTPTPLAIGPSTHAQAQVCAGSESSSGTSTPRRGCLKNAAEGGGRILSEREAEMREARRALRRLREKLEEESQSRGAVGSRSRDVDQGSEGSGAEEFEVRRGLEGWGLDKAGEGGGKGGKGRSWDMSKAKVKRHSYDGYMSYSSPSTSTSGAKDTSKFSSSTSSLTRSSPSTSTSTANANARSSIPTSTGRLYPRLAPTSRRDRHRTERRSASEGDSPFEDEDEDDAFLFPLPVKAGGGGSGSGSSSGRSSWSGGSGKASPSGSGRASPAGERERLSESLSIGRRRLSGGGGGDSNSSVQVTSSETQDGSTAALRSFVRREFGSVGAVAVLPTIPGSRPGSSHLDLATAAASRPGHLGSGRSGHLSAGRSGSVHLHSRTVSDSLVPRVADGSVESWSKSRNGDEDGEEGSGRERSVSGGSAPLHAITSTSSASRLSPPQTAQQPSQLSQQQPAPLSQQQPSQPSAQPTQPSQPPMPQHPQRQKRKTSFSLRMRALRDVGVDVLRGVSSMGGGAGGVGGVRM